jgi:hypothetical protein
MNYKVDHFIPPEAVEAQKAWDEAVKVEAERIAALIDEAVLRMVI